MPNHDVTRRGFLAGLAATTLGGAILPSVGQAASAGSGLISRIDRSVVFKGRGTNEAGWFHPRACIIPTDDGLLALMTMQRSSGSDYFHPVCWTTSADLGKTWTQPEPVLGMGRRPATHIRPGLAVGVCDVTPEFHASTNTVLAVGHNVYYEKGRLARPQGRRWPVYSVRDAQGHWSPLAKLLWDDPRGSLIYTCGCSQRVTLDDGDVLIALSFAPNGRTDRMVTSVRCGFDGQKLTVKQTGNTLELRERRGLLEPSLATFGGRYWMTIRAEDNRGHLSTSDDGLTWSPQEPWCWDDGTPLTMSTTQQHWLAHSEGLFLVYTRRAEHNAHVFRWRAPLYLAQVDPQRRCLIRETEQTVFPLVGNGRTKKTAQHVARMGNFHVNHATPHESWITVGEALPKDGYHGNALLARVTWAKPNRLATVPQRHVPS